MALEPLGGSREPIGGVPGASGKGREPRGAPGGSREPPGRIPRASWGVPGAAVWGVPCMAAGAMGVLLYPGGWLDTMGMKPMGARIGGPPPTHTHTPVRSHVGTSRLGSRAMSQRAPAKCMEPAEDDILILTVTGNLRHRIDKCGIEIPQTEPATDCQRRLCRIARASEQQLGEGKLARPDWAGGAFVFVTKHHAALIQERLEGWMRAERRTFQSKYVFVSASLKEVLTQALHSKEVPDGMTGKEKEQWLKCGKIKEEIRIKEVRNMEEVESTTLRELADTIDAAAETEMRADDKEGASVSDGSEAWTMVDMRTDDKDGWRSHTRWACDGWRGSWSGRWPWDGWRESWSQPSPWGSWRWNNGTGYGWDWSGAQ